MRPAAAPLGVAALVVRLVAGALVHNLDLRRTDGLGISIRLRMSCSFDFDALVVGESCAWQPPADLGRGGKTTADSASAGM